MAVELRVPDLGDFHDVPIIEVLVKAGDRVERDAPVLTLESEKATMEVPASEAGVVTDVAVNVGDRVSTGSVIARVENDGAAQAARSAPPAAEAARSAVPSTNGSSATSATTGVVEASVPDIGDFHDVPVIDVLVKPGDRIERDAPLVTLESEKSTMDVPAQTAGVVEEVRVRVGDRVSRGSVLVTVATDAPNAPEQGTAAPGAPSAVQPEARSAPPPQRAQTVRESAHAERPGAAGSAHASPTIRRFARDLGVQLAAVKGSGPNGRITREDVQAFVKGALAEPKATAATSALGLIAWPKVDFASFGTIERVPLSRIKKLSGPNLSRNWVMIPHVTQHDDADVTDLEAFRTSINAEQKDVKVTMLAFLMKAAAAALRRFADFNASLDGEELVLKKYYNIGFAADTPGGLVVPVVQGVDGKGVLEIARETSALAAKARDGKLSMREMQGGTFTISSLGGIGGTYFSPIINAPEVAILGVCRAAVRPVWDGAAFVPRLMLPLSLSYDHRVVDGAAAARFTVFLAQALGDMRRTLL